MEADCLVLLLMFVFTGTSLTSCEECTKDSDHITTPYKELISTSEATELESQAKNYSVMLFKDNVLFVGARSKVLQVDKDSFTVKRVMNWSSTYNDVASCIQFNRKEECYNFIQVLQPFQGKLLICGTNSYRPSCTWTNLTDLSKATERDNKGNVFRNNIDGVGLVPYSPKFYSTGIISEQGRYYAGTMLDAGGRFPTIFSMDFKIRSRILETNRNDRNWLSGSEFVKTFNIDRYIYFFFREDAIENDYSKTRISSVARICKGDYGGGRFFLKKNFVTFNKARLDCSTPGQYPTQFTNIQDVFWDEKSHAFYAVFTTQPNGVDASAICVYTLQDVELAFIGDYKFYDTINKRWISRKNNHHFENCTVKPTSQVSYPDSIKKRYVPDGMMATRIMTLQALKDSKNYQLMDEKVKPKTDSALFIKLGQRFKNIAVDYVNNKLITYIGTDKPSILKLFDPDGFNRTCIVEEIQLFDDGETGLINQMHLDAQKGYLYVTTPTKVVKLQLARCNRHKDKRSCLESRDPYCGWGTGGCTSWKTRFQKWEQKLDQCPVVKAIWSHWSPWQVCPQRDGNVCQCRKRKCLNTCNARDCRGKPIDLKQCTVNKQKVWSSEADWLREGVIDGNWNTWSRWSSCSVSLGSGVKTRYRYCSDPAPRNGGNTCFGESAKYMDCVVNPPLRELKKEVWTELAGVLGTKDRAMRRSYTCSALGHDLTNISLVIAKTEYVDCHQDSKLCKIPPTTPPGLWSKWSTWSRCVLVGMQDRKRHCKDDDKPCIGARREDRQCYPVPPSTTPGVTTQTTRHTLPTEPDINTSWSPWSGCACNLPFKIVPENDNPDSVGLQHRTRRCREVHPNDIRCPKDRVEYKTCECEKVNTDFKYNKMDDSGRITKKTGYRIGDVIGAAIVTGVLVLVICAVMAYILVRRRQNFDVSKTFEKSMREDPDESRYERTNGVEYPSETSRDRNSSTKLQPVVIEPKTRKALKDLFKKNTKPAAV